MTVILNCVPRRGKGRAEARPYKTLRRARYVDDLDEVEAGEEVGDFEGGGVGGVGAVGAVVADASAEVVADGAGIGFLWIGGAHGVAPFCDAAFGFENHGDDFAGRHKVGEFAEEWAGFVYGVEAASFFFGEAHGFDGDDGEAGFVNTRENVSLLIRLYCIWFNDRESSFDCHLESPKNRSNEAKK
jgi:hypothetical protein